MKRNAIIRIVLWSLVLTILSGLLFAGINRRLWSVRREITYAPLVTEPTYAPLATEPIAIDATSAATSIPDSQGQSNITEIEINWLSGSIRIQPRADIQTIQVKESGDFEERYAMVCYREGNKLKIDYCEDNLFSLNPPRKDLTVWVPQGVSLKELDVDAASATLSVSDLTIQEVEIDTASGKSEFTDCTVGKLHVDTASGDVRFSGSLDRLRCEAASASVTATLQNTPYSLDMDTMSGDLELTLPEDAGFTVNLDAMSQSFRSDFPTVGKNGTYVCGDGRCDIQMDTMSGKITIRKNPS